MPALVSKQMRSRLNVYFYDDLDEIERRTRILDWVRAGELIAFSSPLGKPSKYLTTSVIYKSPLGGKDRDWRVAASAAAF